MCAASSLVWVDSVEQALEISLVASANVTFRLLKARTEEGWLPQNEVSVVRFRFSPNPCQENDDGTTTF